MISSVAEQETSIGVDHLNGVSKGLYALGGLCIAFFIVAQAFQELAYRFWIPPAHTPQDDLLVHLLPADRARAILVMGTIVALIVPFAVIAFRSFKAAPLASTVGLFFGAAFVLFETTHRSMEFFVVGEKWANQFANAGSSAERETILQRLALWDELEHGWFFPQMLSYLLASCSFAVATWKGKGPRRWHYLAPLAFALNALRLLGRLLSNYAGQKWLDGLNGGLYFPAVLTVDTLLVLWFLFLARNTATEGMAT